MLSNPFWLRATPGIKDLLKALPIARFCELKAMSSVVESTHLVLGVPSFPAASDAQQHSFPLSLGSSQWCPKEGCLHLVMVASWENSGWI